VIEFFVPGKPEPAGSKKAFLPKGGSRPVVVDDNAKSKPWKVACAWAGQAAMTGPLLAGPVRLELDFVRARPKAHTKPDGTVRDRYVAAWPTTKPDVLKLARAVEDALSGVVWQDDAQIVVELLVKRYGQQPGVRVRVEELS
jgi:Holliday junction resolvase RusA-like endonuclease